ncbi:putative flavohemoprotein [Aspergillus clavatus NRRL 1]|uniref:nitric oxide dioxygenase n=1 Tax=Aspergillus clavatus (strain ATCC 1007 / CBS 513.65 / DSM 816 / NCTC 3887 / NRRL 1 / QM 1276 / 107) TaxID=344612 RepID=A1CN79_ASPCL|nr:flavohemoprotein, putative [Aspergillus clavatus NRRL 1]EAW07100.1 flavohemoprotein, putative [Aspergillus clavatus NRRL 1]
MDRRVTIASQVAVAAVAGYCLYRIYNAQQHQPSLKESVPPSSAAPLTPEQIAIIKATVPVLKDHGTNITTVFYKNMLTEHPDLNKVFNTANQVNGHQARALAGALFAYASHIDDLGALGPAVELICNKHASLYIQPDDYKIVGKYLLEAMKQVLGDACTDEVLDAWGAAYWALANIMIDREGTLYKESQGWTDWRKFRIAQKVPESDQITSFYLKPVDGKPLPAFKPGQYISVRVDVPQLKYPQARQYSLSDTPRPDYYRISVKKETGLDPSAPGAKRQPGYVSNILHDVQKEGDIVEVSHPYGDFFLSSAEAAHPIVLLSAGVGVTPLMSILNTLAGSSTVQRKIHFIHGSRTSQARAFKDHVQELEKKFPNLQVTFFTSKPSEQDQAGIDYHHLGRIDLQKLGDSADLYLDHPQTEFYICGPEGFMTEMEDCLKARGVGDDRIKLELFGTGGVPHN